MHRHPSELPRSLLPNTRHIRNTRHTTSPTLLTCHVTRFFTAATLIACIAATTVCAFANPKPGEDQRALGAVGVLGGRAIQDDSIVMQSATTIEKVASSGRVLLFSDAVEALRVAGAWNTPKPGDAITLPPRPAVEGKESEPAPPVIRTWAETKAAADGWLPLPGGAYASWVVHSDDDRVMILEAAGHGSVVINNELHTGDPYEYGFVKVPVLLRKGDTELLFKGGRGRVRAQLVKPNADVMLNVGDLTTPDLLIGIKGELSMSLVVINATHQPLNDVFLSLDSLPNGSDLSAAGQQLRHVPPLGPLSARKISFDLLWDGRALGDLPPSEASFRVSLTRGNKPAKPLDEAQLKLAIRKPTDTHKRTFISQIDGSVQYYSVVPQVHPPVPAPADSATTTAKPALVLSLHGASVEAAGQAASYSHKDWCTIVCPTNRRSYGFDWEDWGRLDALEVLDIAQRDLGTDPRRVYLTGHSMGGHGTWNLGVQFPDRFAAIAPSAGWISFLSYAGAAKFDNPTPVQQMLLRANATSDTLSMSRNFLQQGIYILHGDADDNVPVDQARTMRKHLAEYHPDFAYYERAGAGHWWGNECVDWPPLFEFLKRHTLTENKDINHIEFVTANPGTSAKCHWVTIWQQTKAMMPSKVDITVDDKKHTIAGTTENVEIISIDQGVLNTDGDTTVTLDGQEFTVARLAFSNGLFFTGWSNQIGFRRTDNHWQRLDTPEREAKRPNRSGSFKSAFQNNMTFVYATSGTDQENAWAANKARCDAEMFWYRGNGSVRVMSDTDFVAITRRLEDEQKNRNLSLPRYNVILYGNQDTNSAWPLVLSADCPIQIHRDSLKVGDRELKQDNLSCLFVYPMKNDATASVGVIAGTGLPGCRLTDRLPYMVSGVGLPDWTVLSTDMLNEPNAGLIGTGFFGNDWSINHGDSAWK